MAAALAAGETPSPDMVAASGTVEGLRPGIAMALLAGWRHCGLDRGGAAGRKGGPAFENPVRNSAEALTVKARETIQKLAIKSTRWAGLRVRFSYEYARYVPQHDPSRTRWAHIGDGQPDLVHFWYRQSAVLGSRL